MNRRMSFIMQLARTADEVGWLEHELQMADAANADMSGQSARLRELSARIASLAMTTDRMIAKAKQRERV